MPKDLEDIMKEMEQILNDLTDEGWTDEIWTSTDIRILLDEIADLRGKAQQ